MRKIIKGMTNGESVDLEVIGLKGKEIEQVWYIYDEDKMWDSTKFNPYTGQPIVKGEDLEGLMLQHEDGVLADEINHDWKTSEDTFSYFSRYTSLGKRADLLLVIAD